MANARDITLLLEQRHKEDLFVSECKTGPSVQDCIRLDGWAMKKSWAKPLTIGYEIKVSRSDFVRDTKWQGYLDYCNEFYFVCPKGIIDKDELPPEAGLIYTSTNCARLYTKKKSIYRNVDIPESLFKYILFSRTQITEPFFGGSNRSQKLYWEKWLNNKQRDLEFGHHVSKKIREFVREEIDKVEAENKRLTRKMEAYDSIREALIQLGFDPDNPPPTWGAQERIKEAVQLFDRGFFHNIDTIINSMEKLKTHATQIKEKA
ncbi:MAG: MmcB family DNA repair protein [Pseudomonadota bacterium]|nr:MmcB family DNA repair protein [Pseudomonadota bacterium]